MKVWKMKRFIELILIVLIIAGISNGQGQATKNVSNVATTAAPFLQIGAGSRAIGMAGGVEWREESLDVRTDALRRAGLSSSNQQSPVSGSYDVTEAFVEVSAPVLESVVVDAAFRWADYSTVGSVSSWKFIIR